VEARLGDRGEVSGVRLVDGGLVDALGDACLVAALDRAFVEAPASLLARVQIPLTFIYERAAVLPPPAVEPAEPGTAPIDAFSLH
jgi:hypothetical protein